jgi:peptidoglycan LD-endopeptidase LytH
MRRRLIIAVVIAGLLGISALLGYLALNFFSTGVASNSIGYIRRWFEDPAGRPALTNVRAQCPGAPFILPSSGLIGLLWDDPTAPYNLFSPHTGLDIFGAGAPGEDPVYAVYDGYLSRLESWFSTVIIRHDDPLQPGRTIWTYYTHMASEDGTQSFISAAFPPGTSERFVAQGTELGRQGEYSPARPIGLHVHFSIVTSNADGSFRNEAQVANTLDPSPYFGMALDNALQPVRPIGCGL